MPKWVYANPGTAATVWVVRCDKCELAVRSVTRSGAEAVVERHSRRNGHTAYLADTHMTPRVPVSPHS